MVREASYNIITQHGNEWNTQLLDWTYVRIQGAEDHKQLIMIYHHNMTWIVDLT